MTYLVPFNAVFVGEERTIYAVNNDNPENGYRGSTTTSETCPHCNERNFFRVYGHKAEREEEEYLIEVYDCKCPSCHKKFDLEIEHEK